MHAKTSILVCVALASTLSTARADDPPPSEATTEAGSEAAAGGEAKFQLTLPKGRLLLTGFLEINLSDGAEFDPVSLSPDLWYGVTDDITVGLIHSSVGATGFIGGVGDSLCLLDDGCSSIYPNVGVSVRYQLKSSLFSWAVDGGLYAVSTDPFALAIKAGVVGRWQSGPLAIEAAPSLFIGVVERPLAGEETVFLPATVLYTVVPKLALAGQFGVTLPLETIADNYTASLAVGAHYEVNESLTVNAALALPVLITGGEGGGIDARTLTLGGTYAF